MPDRDAILNALRVVVDPDLRRDIVTLGFVKDVVADGGTVSLTIELTTPACPVKDQMRDQAVAALQKLPGVTKANADMTKLYNDGFAKGLADAMKLTAADGQARGSVDARISP